MTVALTGIAVALADAVTSAPAAAQDDRDPAAWGTWHGDGEMPVFEDGNTCLFCHRRDAGESWDTNAHQITIREPGPDAPDGTEYLLGDGAHERYLRRGEGYGKMDLLGEDGAWQADIFGSTCAGCHMTGVDSAAQTFTTLAVDCSMCHGVADPEHTAKPDLMLLSNVGLSDPRAVTSICASCHIRTGHSRSTGLPYANRFVPGDNLFIDFAADLSEAAIGAMAIGERHIYENIRDVMIRGVDDVTCVSCHEVHPQSTKKHEALTRTDRCFTCHDETKAMRETRAYERHSALCGY